jgi:hypothetical protein
VFLRHSQDVWDIVAKAKITQSPLYVFACDCFLGLLFANIIGFRGDQRDEFHAAFHEEIASIFRKGLAGGRGEDLGDDFLDRRWINRDQLGCDALAVE